MSTYPVVKLPFLGCALTAYTGVTPVLDVTEFAEFLRGPDGTCAFCHGDPVAEKPCRDCGGGYMRHVKLTSGGGWQHVPHDESFCTRVTWIDREFAADSRFENCPCCKGRAT